MHWHIIMYTDTLQKPVLAGITATPSSLSWPLNLISSFSRLAVSPSPLSSLSFIFLTFVYHLTACSVVVCNLSNIAAICSFFNLEQQIVNRFIFFISFIHREVANILHTLQKTLRSAAMFDFAGWFILSVHIILKNFQQMCLVFMQKYHYLYVK